MLDTRDVLKSRGWTQGCCFALADLPDAFRSEVPGHLHSPVHVFVVVTHSCTLLNSNLTDEPVFEVIAFAPTEVKQGNDMNLKNTRRLCLDTADVFTARYLIAHARDRFTLPREALLEFGPNPNWALPPTCVHTIISWLVLRFSNVAFPDAFDQRLNPIRNHLVKLFERFPFVESQFYIQLVPNCELPDDQDYRLDILALTPESLLQELEESQTHVLIDAEADLLALFKSCNGIVVPNFQFIEPSRFTAKMQTIFFRWTNFEHVSVKAGRETVALNPGHSP